jgi:hypothetical protein
MNKFAPLLLSLLTVLPTLAAPPAVLDAPSLERQLKGVATLLESSSASRQIEASGKPEALQLRDRARVLFEQSRESLRAGDLAAAQKLLTDASRQLFEGARLAAPPEDKLKRQQTEFQNRLIDARSMLDAQRRVVTEKGGDADGLALVAKVEKLLSEAEPLAAQAPARALALADQAYYLSRAAIGSLRGGETLVRSLNFANKAEEYRYEMDRNDSHRMLVNLLLKEKRDTPGIDRMVQGFIEKSAGLREQAAQRASAEDFEAAVKLMEDATRELVRAIRSAGVFIPG